MPPVIAATCRSVGASAMRSVRQPGSAAPEFRPPKSGTGAAQLLRRAHQRRRLGRAEPDRVDPHPARGGDLGGLDRGDAAGVRAVRQEDDDLRRVRSGRPCRLPPGNVGTRCLRRCGRRGVVDRRDGGVDLGDGDTDVRIAAPIVVPRPVVSESMALIRSSRSVVGCDRELGEARRTRRARSASWSPGPRRSRGRRPGPQLSRLGWTSVAHIDPETSRARISDEAATGRSTLTCGLAPAARGRPARRAPARTARAGATPSVPAGPP